MQQAAAPASPVHLKCTSGARQKNQRRRQRRGKRRDEAPKRRPHRRKERLNLLMVTRARALALADASDRRRVWSVSERTSSEQASAATATKRASKRLAWPPLARARRRRVYERETAASTSAGRRAHLFGWRWRWRRRSRKLARVCARECRRVLELAGGVAMSFEPPRRRKRSLIGADEKAASSNARALAFARSLA